MRRLRRAVSIVRLAVALLMVLAVGLPLAGTVSGPPREPLPPSAPALPPAPTERPLGRYPPDAEGRTITECVSSVPSADVPPDVTRAFCVCVLNRLEERYPSYELFERAKSSGELDASVSDAISNRCVRSLFGG